MTLKPVAGHVLLLDNPTVSMTGGVAVKKGIWSPFLDYVVLSAGSADYGTGDRVVVKNTEVGRKVSLDGVVCRVAPEEDVIAVLEDC